MEFAMLAKAKTVEQEDKVACTGAEISWPKAVHVLQRRVRSNDANSLISAILTILRRRNEQRYGYEKW
jgi:hypothetical protein